MAETDGWHGFQRRPGHAGEVWPINDIIEHEYRQCVCKPRFKFERQADGQIAYIILHQAADGRVQAE